MKIQESGENYLETILRLDEEGGPVRSVDIARRLGFSKPSVSRAMGLLREGGYLDVDEDGGISLTAVGRAEAGRIYERHRLLTDFLISIGVTPETAAEDACRIEHVISNETFERLKQRMGAGG